MSRREKQIKNCVICKQDFLAKQSNSRACSKTCQKKVWYAEHREEEKARVDAYDKENPLKRKGIKLKRYGLTVEEYYKLYTQQNNVCKICKRPCATGRELSVDHCHKTGKVRGLLCSKCNSALGGFEDNIEVILVAIEYLKEYSGELN